MILKVCGCGSLDENPELFSLPGIDYFGFIFYSKSPRNIDKTPQIQSNKVGVFVNEDPEVIRKKIRDEQLSVIQFHGNELPEDILKIDLPVLKWKAVAIEDSADFEQCQAFSGIVDAFLFDTKTPLRGGSGISFDWKLLEYYSGETPFMLSGGIFITHIEDLKKIKHPKLIGFDINSRFEFTPKQKDLLLIQTFIKHLKNDCQ